MAYEEIDLTTLKPMTPKEARDEEIWMAFKRVMGRDRDGPALTEKEYDDAWLMWQLCKMSLHQLKKVGRNYG